MDGIGGGGGMAFGAGDMPQLQFGRERRMHARAYDYWVSLLRGRRMPVLGDLDPQRLSSFAANSVLIDLSGEGGTPGIAFLGAGLRAQAGVGAARPTPADVPEDSLLATLLRRFSDIVACRAALGFEAELAGAGGERILHRGILLPLADEDGALAAIYGVVSWRERASVEDAPDILAAVDGTRSLRAAAPPARAWGDGPGASIAEALAPPPLEQRLAAARTWAALAATDRTRGAASLHAALGAAYDFLIDARAAPAAFASLADGARPTIRAVIGLVFGAQTPPGERRRHGRALAYAGRIGIGAGALTPLLERTDGGAATLAAAERRARRLARGGARSRSPAPDATGRLTLRSVDDDFLPPVACGRRRGADPVAPARFATG